MRLRGRSERVVDGCHSSNPCSTTSSNCARKAQNPAPPPKGGQPGPLPQALARGTTSMRRRVAIRKQIGQPNPVRTRRTRFPTARGTGADAHRGPLGARSHSERTRCSSLASTRCISRGWENGFETTCVGVCCVASASANVSGDHEPSCWFSHRQQDRPRGRLSVC